MRNFHFIISIFVFTGGLIFLGSVLFLHFKNEKRDTGQNGITSKSMANIMSMRLKAIDEAKKQGNKDYQFEISGPLPFASPSFDFEGN